MKKIAAKFFIYLYKICKRNL